MDRTQDPNGMGPDDKQWSRVAAGLCGSDMCFWLEHSCVLAPCGKADQKEQEGGLGGGIQEQWSCRGEAILGTVKCHNLNTMTK